LSIGAFVQNWTSFGGSGNRPDTNQMNLQPFAAYFLPNGWSIGYSGNILANWKADKYSEDEEKGVAFGSCHGQVGWMPHLPASKQGRGASLGTPHSILNEAALAG